MTQPAILEQIANTTLYWEDLTPGMTYSTSSRTITEADVAAFAALTGDFNKVHVDAEFAKGTIFGQRIAHGMLVASFMAGLTSRSIPNQFFEGSLFSVLENRLKFPKPTFIGDTLRVDIEVVEQKTTSRPDRGIVSFMRRGINQRGEVVAEMAATCLFKRRTPGEAQ
ncbi:Acyl dehydratase [Cupriavidus necator]|uniref:Acyl dehydratase n=1 Tax=Cupriavidus necator TaxID=106590 RepID=A0A1K0IF36_CUPNE|nr:Acyl dehydratase [Cupriavidus necator]